MTRFKLDKNLYLDEYIPKELYTNYQDRLHILIGLIDSRLIKADQMLRDVFGSVTINNWYSGGERNWSGLRLSGSPYFSATSQHSFGRASDKIFANASAQEVRTYIKEHWRELGITCIEDDVTWVHSDVRHYFDQKDLLVVKPT